MIFLKLFITPPSTLYEKVYKALSIPSFLLDKRASSLSSLSLIRLFIYSSIQIFVHPFTMYQAIIFAGLAGLVAASPTAQAVDFAVVNAAPSPSLTGPALTANTQYVTYNSASVSSEGAAAATGVASASATVSQSGNAKRGLILGWPWGSGSQPTTSCTTTTIALRPTTNTPQKQTTSSIPPVSSITPTTTTSQITSVSQTTSSDSSCPTTPEAGTYCGFINPEDPCAPQPDG